MKKTNQTFFKVGAKTMMALVLGLFFCSLSVDTYAQGTAAELPASTVDVTILKSYDFISDKEIAFQILKAETQTMMQNTPTGGAAEAAHDLRLFFIYKTAAQLKTGTEVQSALVKSYGLLSGYATAFSGTFDLATIVTDVADLLD